MRLVLYALLVAAIGLAAFLLPPMMAGAQIFATTLPLDLVNRTTSAAHCATAAQCSRGTPIVRVEMLNCGRIVHTYNITIPANGQPETVVITHECGSWPRLRIYVEYFGLRPACTISASYNRDFLYTAIQIRGPYQRTWSDEKGVFECSNKLVEKNPAWLVRNGRVDFYNGGSLPTWLGYQPNGCNPVAGLAGITPHSRGLAAGERAGGYYSLYNHECGKYSRFWFEYGGDSSWCPARELNGNREFIRYGFFEPGWCEVHDRNF